MFESFVKKIFIQFLIEQPMFFQSVPTFFWKGGELLKKIDPGHTPERLPGWNLLTFDFRYFKIKFAGCKRDIPSGIEK